MARIMFLGRRYVASLLVSQCICFADKSVLCCLGGCGYHLALGDAVCGHAVPDFRRRVAADRAGVSGSSWAESEDSDFEWKE